MNKKYEISVWKDTYINDKWEEEKLIVIGSDTMTSQSRAREPKLISNINGTNTFSFLIYYSYIDTETGEKVKNPFIPFLVNERKIKVYWKKEWYEFLIKDIKEDSVNHTFTYTCEDMYLTELSRSGFSLEFTSELQNNIGTPQELVEKVIENTDWQFDSENSDTIYQVTEEAVYVVNALKDFTAITNPDYNEVTITNGTELLVFYSCAPAAKEDALKTNLQFVYAIDGIWKQDDNDMLVLNGQCCNINVSWEVDTEANTATAFNNDMPILIIYFSNGVSKQYRAERYVDSQKTVFSPIVNRYVDVYTQNGKEIYGYQTVEFNNATTVINLITNPSNFTDASGWSKADSDENGLLFRVYPPFTKEVNVAEYVAKSYLRVCGKQTYTNSGIQNNRSYIKDGFAKNEVYILRYKCFGNRTSLPDGQYTFPNLSPTIPGYFKTGASFINGNWLEFELTCTEPCAFNELLDIANKPVITLTAPSGNLDYWIEEIQFFKKVEGERWVEDATAPEGGRFITVRINPNELDVQSVSQSVYHFFDPAQEGVSSIDDVQFISGENAVPVTNQFQRFGTIEESQSNRFNILQSIAEAFECWVRFRIDHDDEGYITYTDGKADKYIQLKREIGQDSGLTFVYGIDLSGVTRTLTSTSISTKTIVLSNSNEFGKNGFCTIARSTQNYSRENVIYNFDYYVQQGLLDKEIIEKDLYEYYNILHDNNTQYESNLEVLTQKKTELTRQTAQQTVYEQYLTSATSERTSIENDLIKLAGVNTLQDALLYAQRHLNNQKVQALINDRVYIINTQNSYKNLLASITKSIEILNKTIEDLKNKQSVIINTLVKENTKFYKKYARFIQEGTWQSEDYYNDDLYYLDALQVAYESSRPQITYNINVLRLSETVDFSSKVFHLADIAYIQDTEYFGYKDEFTPYKEKVFLSEVTSFFDSPEKDSLKVQNYLTQFDDLFQRITAATQNLEFSQGKYAKAANIVATDGTIKASVIQETFNSNADLVYGAQNESATIDETGITVTNNDDGSHLVRVTSGGIFVSNDGGETWKNAIRGDGISTDLLTAGRINTQEINIYDSDVPSFRWDSLGINAYGQTPIYEDDTHQTIKYYEVDTSTFVRFDQYGMYGLHWTKEEEFKPTKLQDIYDNASFGLTWEKFFIKSKGENGSVEISSDNDIYITAVDENGQEVPRIIIGRLDNSQYGINIKDMQGNDVFLCNNEVAQLAGWEITQAGLKSKPVAVTNSQHIEIGSDGSIGCIGDEAMTSLELAYPTTTQTTFDVTNLVTGESSTFRNNKPIYVFSSTVGKITTQREVAGPYNTTYREPTSDFIPQPLHIINIGIPASADGSICDNYRVAASADEISWNVTSSTTYQTKVIDPSQAATDDNVLTTYYYHFTFAAKINNQTIFTLPTRQNTRELSRYVPKASNAWTIDNEGNAIFHNLFADGGQIAGWYIDNERIYQTWDGTSNIGENGSNIKSELNSSGTANRDGIDYSVVTDAINAAMANIGGVLMSGGLINGYNIAQVMSKAQAAGTKADKAYQLAYQVSQSLKDYVKTSTYNGHRHQVWVYKGDGDVGQWNRSQTPTY